MDKDEMTETFKKIINSNGAEFGNYKNRTSMLIYGEQLEKLLNMFGLFLEPKENFTEEEIKNNKISKEHLKEIKERKNL